MMMLHRQVVLTLTILILLSCATGASGASRLVERGALAVGFSSGLNQPLAQDDAALGFSYGAKLRAALSRRFAAEGGIDWTKSRNGNTPSGGPLEAPSLRSGMLSAVLRNPGLGFTTTLRAGLGLTRVGLPGSLGSDTELSYAFGLGAELPVGPISLELEPRLSFIDTGDAMRKHFELRLGALYSFR
jgi:hypothetical protein